MFPHQFGRANPGGGLLADFSQGMKVPESPLLFFISFQKFPGYVLGLRQLTQPIFLRTRRRLRGDVHTKIRPKIIESNGKVNESKRRIKQISRCNRSCQR